MLFALLGGFGNNGGGRYNGGNGGGYGAGNIGGNEIYPWLNQAQLTNDGFRDQMINDTINATHQSVNNLSTQLCNCCADMQMALANGFAGVEQGANARQMANMNQMFGMQTATMQGFNDIQGALCNGFNSTQNIVNQGFNGTQMGMLQGFNGLQAQLADCCCENRLATANQTATILAENCADRAALSDGVRDIIANQTANTQRIVDNDNANYRQIFDWLCNKELRDEQRENDQLRSQLQFANMQASQIAQTGQIVDGIYNRLSTCPVGTQPVYGNQPIFTCQNNGCGCNSGCGCGM